MSELTAVEEPLAQQLLAGRHDIRRQVQCGSGRCDIFDDTTSELIECKAVGNVASIAAAIQQLNRYRHHFCDPQLAIAIPVLLPEAEWLRPALDDRAIRVIEMDKGGTGI